MRKLIGRRTNENQPMATSVARDDRLSRATPKGCYSGTVSPDPPISFGTSFIFGRPSMMCSFVS